MRIELRKYKSEDIESLASLANDFEVSKNLRDIFPHPYTEDDASKFINFVTTLSSDKGIEYVITIDDIFVGAIGMSFSTDIYRTTAEIGYWLGSPFWNQGIISKAIEMMVTYTFDNYPIHKICAEVFADNIGSQKALEKNGFILEGTLKDHIYKHNKYHDILLYGLCR